MYLLSDTTNIQCCTCEFSLLLLGQFWNRYQMNIRCIFFNSIKVLIYYSSSKWVRVWKRVCRYVSLWEYVDTCLCHRICVLVPMCLYIVFPTLGSHKTKKYYSVMKNRLNYKIPPTWANWALESLIWHLLEYYIICEWNFYQNENPSPYFAALSLPSPVLQVCNVWAQFLGEFPICLCACYLWQRTVPGQQL